MVHPHRIGAISTLILSAVLFAGCQAASDDEPGASGTGTAGSAATGDAGLVDASVDSADGVPIHYSAQGSGDPALVFIHCWSCDISFWREQVPHFAPRHRVVTIDLAGHGTSGTERESWTVSAFAQDVRAVVEALQLDRVVLVGHSLGAYVMVEAARQFPERIVGLVAVDTLQDAELSPAPDEIDGFLEPFASDFRQATSEYVRSLFGAGTDPTLIERITNEIAGANPEIGVACLRGVFEYQLTPALSEIKLPITAIVSERFPVRLEINRKYVPQFKVATISGVGHFAMLEDPDAFNVQLEETLRGLTEAP